VKLKNRIAKAAMTEGLAGADGFANPRHARLYRRWAEGGIGLSITGNVMVDWRYLERPGNVVVEEFGGQEGLEAWAQAGTTDGCQLWMQINHPGRQCARTTNARPVAPSAVQLQLAGLFARPREMKDAEIEATLDAYARVARRAIAAGFSGVQIHAAHGYLGSQFLSPIVNKRSDRWGGALENRARFVVEAVRRTRAAVGPDVPVAVKLNSADFQRGGFQLEDAARVAAWLAEEGIDLLEVSGGTYERLVFLESGDTRAESTRRREAYFLEYAQTLRASVGDVPLMVTGGFRTREAMSAALRDGEVDVVGLARPLCVDPDLPSKFLEGSVATAPTPEQDLALGSGWLRPGSGNKTVRGLNHQAQTAWFYRHIIALAEGRPAPRLSARQALFAHFSDELYLARARKRIRR
jgi:2,4-dienoyl-CoA reductase-like NADH-dependent reductase (Old Yellow Enzyme family)